MKSHNLKEVPLTPEQKYKMDVANVAFMQECPFHAHLAYSIARYVFTRDLPMAGTDGRHVFLNPDYVCGLKVSEQIAVLAHEIGGHLVTRHPQRFAYYQRVGEIKGKPVDQQLANVAADYVINADILATIPRASLNPDWLYDPAIKGDELWEDVYVKLFNEREQQQQQQQQQPQGCQGSGAGEGANKRRRDAPGALKGAAGDPKANANGGGFDEVLAPPVDSASGAPDLPDESEFLEAVSRAHAAAKAMGKLPASIERLVKDLLEPQVDWRDHVRMLITSRIGSDRSTWTKANRRRLVFNPIVIMPGKTGHGADTVVVGVDTSGSISERELSAFWAEVGGVLADCRPRRIIVIGCDAAVRERDVHEVTSLDELEHTRMQGLGGGGGTSFVPVFEYCGEHDIRPETLIYLTDGYGQFPAEAPAYPTIWAMTTDQQAPFGEVVRLKV
jgi:predicted metal-dependent peptidase